MAQNVYQKFLRSPFRKPVGVVLIVVGLAALLTPLTPGSWLALIGLELMGWRFVFHNRYARFKEKFRSGSHETEKGDTENTL